MKTRPEAKLNKMRSRNLDNNIVTVKYDTTFNLWNFTSLREGQVELGNNTWLFLNK